MSAEDHAQTAGPFRMSRACRIEVTAVTTDAKPETIRITDESTRAEIAEAITHLAQYAARQMHHVDCSRWVRAHERIDHLLDDWEAAKA